MGTRVTAKMENGVDTMLRVVGTLRRKDYGILNVEMTTGGSDLLITLEGDLQRVRCAVDHMEKVYGLHHIRVL